MKSVGILNGPNLQRLGLREPEIYGSTTLAELQQELDRVAARLGVRLEHFQSNHEGELIDRIYTWADAGVSEIVFNPGAFTHTSVALRDAIAGASVRVVEVHISNTFKREAFRHRSYTAPVCAGVIVGLGLHGYTAALEYLCASEPA